jgi:hypothetical protein
MGGGSKSEEIERSVVSVKLLGALERFTEKWNPVFDYEARQIKEIERFFVSVKLLGALDREKPVRKGRIR